MGVIHDIVIVFQKIKFDHENGQWNHE